MPRPAPLPPELAGSPFAVRDALRAGLGRQRLRARDLSAPFRGIRSPHPAPASHVERCVAYAPLLGADRFFSHRSAALLYGIPVPRDDVAPIDVAVCAPAHPPRARGVLGHRLAEGAPVRLVRGVPVVEPARVWRQLAEMLGETELVVAGDFLLRRKRPLCTIAELRAAAALLGRGARMARRALARVRPGTDSPMESRLRLLLVDAGLPEPLVGHTVRDRDGGFIATPDLAYPDERVAIEYQGATHRSDRRAYTEDIARREALEDAGWHVIEVVADHLGPATPLLVRRVTEALARSRSLS